MISSDRITLQHESFSRLCAMGADLARHKGRPLLVSATYSVSVGDPLAIFQTAQSLGLNPLYWSVPSRRFTLLGLGQASVFEAEGDNRFDRLTDGWRRLIADALIMSPVDLPGTGPVLMGGFSFDPASCNDPRWDGFSDARLVLPRVTLCILGDDAWLTHNLVLEPGESAPARLIDDTLLDSILNAPYRNVNQPGLTLYEEDKAVWIAKVAETAATLQKGLLEKVVLARAVRAESAEPILPCAALKRLRSTYPDCFLFSLTQGGKTFLGATPEQLLRVQGGQVETMCLAGSMGRGRTAEEDQRLGQALLGSEKERREHRLVVQMIRDELLEVCEDLKHPEEPGLLKLGNVQHLYTPIRARFREGFTLFDVLARLHPTPAVGGTPQKAAMEYIRRHEGFDRGWYASPVGWIDSREDGEFAVALRSALIEGREATLFAGCGIMPDSDPESEYEESRLKLRPMIDALGGEAE